MAFIGYALGVFAFVAVLGVVFWWSSKMTTKK